MKKVLCFFVLIASGCISFCAEEAFAASRDLRVHEAVRAGDLNWLTTLQSLCADFNARDVWGQTPLHLAARFGTQPIVDFLVEVDVLGQPITELNAKSCTGSTPLHIAVKAGRFNVVKSLVEAGADIHARDNEHMTPLLCLFAQKVEDACRIAEFLIQRGADVNAQNCYTSSVLDGAINFELESLVKLLIDKEADLNLKNGMGDSPLHAAILMRNPVIVELLVSGGADVNDLNLTQCTPLRCALLLGNRRIARYLLENGGVLNARERQEETVLHYAAHDGHNEIISILIRRGLDVNAKTKAEQQTPLHQAAGAGHVETVQLLIQHGAAIDAGDTDGWTPLHQAAGSGQYEVIEFLATQGADVACKAHNGETLLMPLLKWVDSHPEDREKYKPAIHVLLTFGVTLSDNVVNGDNELKLLKKYYPEYHIWLKEKKEALDEILKKTVVTGLPTDLQNEIQSFVLTSLPKGRRLAPAEAEDPRPAKKSKNSE